MVSNFQQFQLYFIKNNAYFMNCIDINKEYYLFES